MYRGRRKRPLNLFVSSMCNELALIDLSRRQHFGISPYVLLLLPFCSIFLLVAGARCVSSQRRTRQRSIIYTGRQVFCSPRDAREHPEWLVRTTSSSEIETIFKGCWTQFLPPFLCVAESGWRPGPALPGRERCLSTM